jgi:hypothetical protein
MATPFGARHDGFFHGDRERESENRLGDRSAVSAGDDRQRIGPAEVGSRPLSAWLPFLHAGLYTGGSLG